MSEYTLVIGNKNYSSWSMRPWLVLRQAGADFDEIVIPLRHPDTKAQILAHSPAGKVPILKHGDRVIWDSLAIFEYLAERFPDKGLWPEDAEVRARARSVSAEMHSGFPALRNHMPMDLRSKHPGKGFGEGVIDDIKRICDLWSDCRVRFGDGGPFLFGRFSMADAMYAPVVGRFVTYGVNLPPSAKDYVEAVWEHPHVWEWRDAAEKEPWTFEFDLV